MVHWIQHFDWLKKNELEEIYRRLERDYSQHRWDIFFQFWLTHVIWNCDTRKLKRDEKQVESYQKIKQKLNKKMFDSLALQPSRREHMPDTTVRIPLLGGISDIRSWYSSSCKRYINKAKKEELHFEEAEPRDREKFREIRYTMAYDKWFSIVPKQQFLDLMLYLTWENHGKLFLAKKWRNIVSWSLILFLWDELIYLYWATDRTYGHIWSHYWLKDNIFKRWSQKWYRSLDLLWVAPPWNAKHYLHGVTRFKQSFWWETIAYWGNFDAIFQPFLYRTFQLMRS